MYSNGNEKNEGMDGDVKERGRGRWFETKLCKWVAAVVAVTYLTDPHVYASIVLSNIEVKVFILYLHVPTFGKFAFEPFGLCARSCRCFSILFANKKQFKLVGKSDVVGLRLLVLTRHRWCQTLPIDRLMHL